MMRIIRSLHKTTRLLETLPSTPEMKSNWNISNKSTNLTSKVMSMSNLMNNEPPLDIDDQFTKKFKLYDNYDPFDLSDAKLNIDSRLKKYPINKKSKDPFEKYGINPLDLYTMPFILSRFLTSTGQILSRDITGCNAKNQKKLSIAIKRARTCGLLSHVHKDSSFLPSRSL